MRIPITASASSRLGRRRVEHDLTDRQPHRREDEITICDTRGEGERQRQRQREDFDDTAGRDVRICEEELVHREPGGQHGVELLLVDPDLAGGCPQVTSAQRHVARGELDGTGDAADSDGIRRQMKTVDRATKQLREQDAARVDVKLNVAAYSSRYMRSGAVTPSRSRPLRKT